MKERASGYPATWRSDGGCGFTALGPAEKGRRSGAWLASSSGTWVQEECGVRRMCEQEGIVPAGPDGLGAGGRAAADTVPCSGR